MSKDLLSPGAVADEEMLRNGLCVTELGNSSWVPVDLTAALAGRELDRRPNILRRDDGHALIYPGKLHALNGEPESGKSWVAQYACQQELAVGQAVIFVDFEDGPDPVVARLLALGADPEAIRTRFHYLRPDEPLERLDREGRHRHAFLDLLADTTPSLVVIDGVTESMGVHGLSLKDNDDIAAWIARLPRLVTRRGIACVLIDHVTKDREGRGRWAIGGQHKMAGIDGAAYTVEIVKPFGRGRTGHAHIDVTKDRPGWVRATTPAGKRVAEFTLEANHDGTKATPQLHSPDHTDETTFRPTTLMEKASRFIEQNPGLSTNSIKSSVGGKGEFVGLALELLVKEGFVALTQDRQRRLHTSVKAFRDDQ